VDPVDTAHQELAATPEVAFALVFGSRARGRHRPDSDLDLAVYLDPSLDRKGRFRVLADLASRMPLDPPTDLVVLNDAPALLGHQALMGRRLFIRDGRAWERYFVRTLAAAEDERYHRSIHDRARSRRLAEGRFGRS